MACRLPPWTTHVAHALVRFGLGRRGGEPLPADPGAWARAQLSGPDPLRLANPPTTAAGLAALREDRENRPPPAQSRGRAVFRQDAAAQLGNALTTPSPFRERLVWFWTNHFTVSLRRGDCAALVGAFVEEAIRPHVTGRFVDMLLAVMRHPAMLLYLDNVASAGPNSPAGQRGKRGLNENLARECLELHTVSPAAGYTQADVTNFARVLTGWSIDLRGDPPGFRFRPFAHEPGEQTVMGRRFPPGEEGGVAALRFLAAHPETHRFLAAKLVRHFVADDPPEDAVRRIAGVLRDTDGDLAAAAAMLTTLEAAWQPQTKLRTPLDHLIATLRALEAPPAAAGSALSDRRSRRARPAVLDRPAAERLAGPCGGLGGSRDAAPPDRLGLCRRRQVQRARPGRGGGGEPRSAACSPPRSRPCMVRARGATR